MSYLFDSFSSGYSLGSKMRERRDERREKAAKKELAKAYAGVDAIPPPEAAPAIDQMQDVPQAESDAELGGYSYQKAVETGLQQFNKQAGKKPVTTAMWADNRAKLLEAAANTGDPEAVAKANKYITDMQHKGFLDNLKMANVFMNSGNAKKAADYLSKAYHYFPDGQNGEFAVTPDGKSVVLRPTDEVTGEVRPMIVLDKKKITEMLGNFTDPVAFAQWNYEQQVKADETRYRRGRETEQDKRAAEKHRQDMAQAQENLAKLREERARAAREYDPATPEGQARLRALDQKIAQAEAATEEARRRLSPEGRARTAAETAAAEATARKEEMLAREATTPAAAVQREREAALKAQKIEAEIQRLKALAASYSTRGRMTPKQKQDARRDINKLIGPLLDDITAFEPGTPEYINLSAQIGELQRQMAEIERMPVIGEPDVRGSGIPAPGASARSTGVVTATGPNGERLQLINGNWVPMNTTAP